MTNPNYKSFPSTEDCYNAYETFRMMHEDEQHPIHPFEELNYDERILIYYWLDVQSKLNIAKLNSQINLYAVLSEAYKKCIYKFMESKDEIM